MGSWLKMIKELTIRPKERKIREAPPYPFDGDMNNPLSGVKVKELLSMSSDVVFRVRVASQSWSLHSSD